MISTVGMFIVSVAIVLAEVHLGKVLVEAHPKWAWLIATLAVLVAIAVELLFGILTATLIS